MQCNSGRVPRFLPKITGSLSTSTTVYAQSYGLRPMPRCLTGIRSSRGPHISTFYPVTGTRYHDCLQSLHLRFLFRWFVLQLLVVLDKSSSIRTILHRGPAFYTTPGSNKLFNTPQIPSLASPSGNKKPVGIPPTSSSVTAPARHSSPEKRPRPLPHVFFSSSHTDGR